MTNNPVKKRGRAAGRVKPTGPLLSWGNKRGARSENPGPGITYMVVDGTGRLHCRFFRSHTHPHYTVAVVRRPGGNRADDVSMFKDPLMARDRLRWAEESVYDAMAAELAGNPALEGEPMYPLARIEVVTWRWGE